MIRRAIFMFLFIAVAVPRVEAANFVVDPVYSTVLFKLDHLGGENIGAFERINGTIQTSEDLKKLEGLIVYVDITSINTRNLERDKELVSGKYFDSTAHPVAKFVGKKIAQDKLIGDLTIKGKTKEVAFDLVFAATAKDQEGRTKFGLAARGVINRNDFGMNYNVKLPKGEGLIGEEVELTVEIEGLLESDNK